MLVGPNYLTLASLCGLVGLYTTSSFAAMIITTATRDLSLTIHVKIVCNKLLRQSTDMGVFLTKMV